MKWNFTLHLIRGWNNVLSISPWKSTLVLERKWHLFVTSRIHKIQVVIHVIISFLITEWLWYVNNHLSFDIECQIAVRFVYIRYILFCFFFNIECSFGTTCCTRTKIQEQDFFLDQTEITQWQNCYSRSKSNLGNHVTTDETKGCRAWRMSSRY